MTNLADRATQAFEAHVAEANRNVLAAREAVLDLAARILGYIRLEDGRFAFNGKQVATKVTWEGGTLLEWSAEGTLEVEGQHFDLVGNAPHPHLSGVTEPHLYRRRWVGTDCPDWTRRQPGHGWERARIESLVDLGRMIAEYDERVGG